MSAMGDFVIDVGERVARALHIEPEWGDQLVGRYADHADEAAAAAAKDGIHDINLLAQCAAEAVVEAFHAEASATFGTLPKAS